MRSHLLTAALLALPCATLIGQAGPPSLANGADALPPSPRLRRTAEASAEAGRRGRAVAAFGRVGGQSGPTTPPKPPVADVTTLVSRLDLEKYKTTIKGLTQFGDRRQGTERNRKAVDWIEAQLKSYGCPTERIKYRVQPAAANRAGRGRPWRTRWRTGRRAAEFRAPRGAAVFEAIARRPASTTMR